MAVVEDPTTWFEDIVDSIGKFQPVLPQCVRAELETLASGPGKKARLARVSLDMSSKFEALSCGKASVDDEIASMARSLSAMVATADSGLASSLRSSRVRVISLKKGRISLN